MRTVCIIPAYKPSEDMVLFTQQLLDEEFDVLVVDDGSGQEFDAIFSALPDKVVLLRHEVNRGKGCALKTAMQHVLDSMPEAEAVVTADADGQHKVSYISLARDMLKSEPNVLVLGGRRFDGDVPFRSKFGNWLTRNVFAIASGTKVYDTQTGLRAFSRSNIAELIAVKGDRYEYEMNMLLTAARNGMDIREFTIETIYINDNASSHFNPIRDSLKIYGCIALFTLSAIISFLVDYGLFLLLAPFTGLYFSKKISLLISEVVARILSSIVNFAMNKYVVFKGNEKTVAAIVKYFVLCAFILAADYGIVLLFVQTLHVHEAAAKIFAGIILFVVNMVLQGRLVFRKKAEPKEA